MQEKYSLLRYYLGDILFQNSIISEGNWLVYADYASLQDYQNTWTFNEYQTNQIKAKLSQIDQYLSSQGIKVYIVIPPNKNTIYPEYVPDEIPVIGEVSRYDQMIEILSEYGNITFIDSREILLEARTHKQVYYATDTHWNRYGAYFTYEAIINEINKTYPEIKPSSLEDFEVINLKEFVGDVANNLINIDIQEQNFMLVNTQVTQYDYYEITDQYKKYIIPDSIAPKILLFHDSFATLLLPFLKDNFSQTVAIHNSEHNFSYIDFEKPDIIIFEWTERIFFNFIMSLPDM